MIYFILLWFIFGLCSAIIANEKGLDGCLGFIVGFALGPIGLLIIMILRADQKALDKKELRKGELKECPFCAELIKSKATKCRYCGSELITPDKTQGEIFKEPQKNEITNQIKNDNLQDLLSVQPLIKSKAKTKSKSQPLMKKHPFFTGACPECGYKFPEKKLYTEKWECPECGWYDK